MSFNSQQQQQQQQMGVPAGNAPSVSSLTAGENFVLSSTSPTLAYLESFNSLSSVSTPTGATQQQQQQQPPPNLLLNHPMEDLVQVDLIHQY